MLFHSCLCQLHKYIKKIKRRKEIKRKRKKNSSRRASMQLQQVAFSLLLVCLLLMGYQLSTLLGRNHHCGPKSSHRASSDDTVACTPALLRRRYPSPSLQPPTRRLPCSRLHPLVTRFWLGRFPKKKGFGLGGVGWNKKLA